jgi:hypothetical protein
LFAKKILLVTPTVLLMFTRPSELGGKLLLQPMDWQAVQAWKQKALLSMRMGGGGMRMEWMRRRTKMLRRLRWG